MSEEGAKINPPEYVTQDSVAHKSATAEQPDVASLQKKLSRSRVLNAVLAAALVFVGGAYAALSLNKPGDALANANAVQQPATQQQTTVDAAMIAATDYMTLGSADAPVTLYEWTDFTCPYCGVFNRETLPVLIEEYINTGKVRLEMHDVTYIGPQAEDAAVAARAAGLQGKYFDYLFGVYELGRNDNRPDLSVEQLKALAAEIGLDLNKFESDFNSVTLRQEVQSSTQLAQSLGVTGVPFFVGASTSTLEGLTSLNGAQPLESFREFLDQQVAANS